MKRQTNTAPQRGMPVEDVGGSSARVAVTGETVAFYYSNSGTRTVDAGQAIGVVVEAVLAYAPIASSSGDQVGTAENTSLSFTSTAFTTEIRLSHEDIERLDGVSFAQKLSLVQTFVANKKTADAAGVPTVMANGDYIVDYRHGVLIGKKASTQTTLTSGAYLVIQKGGSPAITSIIPGTGATNLGKAEDSAHASGDVGVMSLGVRTDTPTSLAGATGDYMPYILDALNHMWMREGYVDQAVDNTNGVFANATKPLAVATYSYTQFQNLGANATLNVKATPGNVYSLYCHNVSGGVRYLQLHNSATTSSGAPLQTFLVPAGGTLILDAAYFGPQGLNFSTGIAFGFSTTEATYTAATASDHITQINFK